MKNEYTIQKPFEKLIIKPKKWKFDEIKFIKEEDEIRIFVICDGAGFEIELKDKELKQFQEFIKK